MPPKVETESHLDKIIEAGNMFIARKAFSTFNAVDANQLYVVVTGAKKVNMTMSIGNFGQALLQVYTGATISNNGTALTIGNRVLGSSNTPTVAVYRDPTQSDLGTELTYLARSIPPQNPPGGLPSDRVVLEANTVYLVSHDQQQDNGAGTVCFEWYEIG